MKYKHHIVEGLHGTGAIDSPHDVRDYKYHRVKGLGMAPVPFDWNAGYDIEQRLGFPILPEDQGISSACSLNGKRTKEVPLALKAKTFLRLSGHDLYDHIFYPTGGSTMRDIAKWLVQVGIREESVVTSYMNGMPPTEAFMRDRSLSNAATSPLYKGFGYAFPKTDIETIACATRDNGVCLIQITGYDNLSWRTTFPQTRIAGAAWSHFITVGKLKLINGKRFVGILNSWGNVGEAGWQWLSEDFFNGLVTNAMVIFDQDEYNYQPTIVQTVAPTWLQKAINFFLNYFTVSA